VLPGSGPAFPSWRGAVVFGAPAQDAEVKQHDSGPIGRGATIEPEPILSQRPGQAVFNALARLDPDFADTIRGGALDPFHDDRRIEAALAAWRARLRG
jgi:hypothetical protein